LHSKQKDYLLNLCCITGVAVPFRLDYYIHATIRNTLDLFLPVSLVIGSCPNTAENESGKGTVNIPLLTRSLHPISNDLTQLLDTACTMYRCI